MSLKAKPSTSPTTPAEPSTAPINEVAPSRFSATSTPSSTITVLTVLRSRPSMYGLLRLIRSSTCMRRLTTPPSHSEHSTIRMASTSSGALTTSLTSLASSSPNAFSKCAGNCAA